MTELGPHRGAGAREGPAGRSRDLTRLRSQAKLGMTASLGVLAGTGIMEALGSSSPAVKTVHVVSGFALIGFSLWHYSLYRSQSRGF